MRLRATTWLLAIAGVFVGHLVGYTLAHPDEADRALALSGHAYFGPAASVLVPLGAMAMLVVAVRTARRLGEAPTVLQLAGAQVGLFAVQEVAERAVGSEGAARVIAERGVWLGLVAQVAIAWLSVRLVGLTARVVRRVVLGDRPSPKVAPRLVVRAIAAVAPCRSVELRLPSRRGPPRQLGAALSM